jgi:hypothetical protein
MSIVRPFDKIRHVSKAHGSETLRFASMSFADISDFVKQADNAHRTIQSFSFPHKVEDSPFTVTL